MNIKSSILIFIFNFFVSFLFAQAGNGFLDSTYEKGISYFAGKEYKLAIESFSEILRLKPTDLNSYFNRAASYYKIGDKTSACNDWGQGYLMGDKEAAEKLEKYCTQFIPDNNEVVIIQDSLLDQVAEFPGGDSTLINYIYSNIKFGPADLPRLGNKDSIGFDLVIHFVVLKDGTIGYQRIFTSLGANIDNQAFKLFFKMPRWSPAIISGQSVASRVKLSLPFIMKFVPYKIRSRSHYLGRWSR